MFYGTIIASLIAERYLYRNINYSSGRRIQMPKLQRRSFMNSEEVRKFPNGDLLAGSNIVLKSRGMHTLKGLEGEREVFLVMDQAS